MIPVDLCQSSFHTDLPADTRRLEIIPGKAVRVAQIRSCVEDISLRIKEQAKMLCNWATKREVISCAVLSWSFLLLLHNCFTLV